MCNLVCLPMLITALFAIAVAFDDTTEITALSTLNNVTASNVNRSEVVEEKSSINDQVKFFSDSQMKAIKEVGVRLAAVDIDRMEHQSAWNILDKTNLNGELALDQLLKHMLDDCYHCYFIAFLQFVNSTSNIDWKVNGYLEYRIKQIYQKLVEFTVRC